MVNKILLVLGAALAPGQVTTTRTVSVNPAGECALYEGKNHMWDLPDLVMVNSHYGYCADHEFVDEDACWRARLEWEDRYGKQVTYATDCQQVQGSFEIDGLKFEAQVTLPKE